MNTLSPSFVTSKDGTKIAYDAKGKGPLVVCVAGALWTRVEWARSGVADLLSRSSTVLSYDRRGRGDSTDTSPYSPEREVEDIEALLGAFGGSGSLYGMSSGAALALSAASTLGRRVERLALYEAPYDSSPGGRGRWEAYNRELRTFVSCGRNGDAVAFFMKFATGTSEERIAQMRRAATWEAMERLAPTLLYDAALLGEDRSLPAAAAAKVVSPTLVVSGSASLPIFAETAKALSRAIPGARLRILEGQRHNVQAEAIAPVLAEFFSGRWRARHTERTSTTSSTRRRGGRRRTDRTPRRRAFLGTRGISLTRERRLCPWGWPSSPAALSGWLAGRDGVHPPLVR